MNATVETQGINIRVKRIKEVGAKHGEAHPRPINSSRSVAR
jgi:hypothetical protein